MFSVITEWFLHSVPTFCIQSMLKNAHAFVTNKTFNTLPSHNLNLQISK